MTDPDPNTPTPTPTPALSSTALPQGMTDVDNDSLPDDDPRKKKKPVSFADLDQSQQNNLSMFMWLLKILLGAEDKQQANGKDPSQDPFFQQLNNNFATALGMNQTQFTEFTHNVRQPNYDWKQDQPLVTRLRNNGSLDQGGSISNLASNPKSMLDMIAAHESGGNYNVMLGGKTANLTGGSINDAIRLGKENVSRGAASSAVGRYQFLSGTLEGLKKQLGLTGNEKFDEAMQDKLATQLMKNRGLDSYLAGKICPDAFMKNLSMEWASLPAAMDGHGYYDGYAGNRAASGIAGKEMALLADLKRTGSVSGSGINGPNISPPFNGSASGTVLASNTPTPTASPGARPNAPANG